ncbi:MAG: hypothetical protein II877_05585 [Synergistaceae bacterium]|nr:hypothetical protein [Synergistaceae bacterium]
MSRLFKNTTASKLKPELMAALFAPVEEVKAQKEAQAEAERIMRQVVKDADLLEGIEERASIQWEQGLSDSLYQTVLRGLMECNEQIERDADGRAILKPITDWDAELKKYRQAN